METMKNLEQNNNTEPTDTTPQPPVAEPSVPQEPTDVNLPTEGQEPAGSGENTPPTGAENNLKEWQKDKRYGNMWKTEDDMYKSYRELEAKYPELKGKLDKIVAQLSKHGLTDENIEAELEKIAEYRNPESRINQLFNYFNSWMTNDLYKDKVLQFFNELEAAERQRIYPNMTAEQIAKQVQLEQELNKLKAAEAERQTKFEEERNLTAINNGIAECEEICRKYGLKFTPAAKAFLLDHCYKNDILPQYIKNEFINLYGQKLLEARDRRTLANANANNVKLKNAKIIHGGSGNVKPSANLKGRAAFLEGIKSLWK